MAYYQYYQNGAPTWGTNSYQFQAPPMPNYVPQPSWTGADYYTAHADAQDSSLFDYVWSKARSVFTGGSVSRGEAEHWHRRVYGGLVQVASLQAREIGAAAGWETVRLWQSHNSIYQSPLSGEREREREAIVGLAIAEASRLWQYTGRPLDKYGRREASEVAAATASRVYMQLYDYDSPYDPYRTYDASPYDRRRRNSFSYDDGSVAGGYAATSTYRSPSPIPIQRNGSPYAAPAMLPGGSPYGAQMYLPPAGGVSPYAQPVPLSASPYQNAYYGQQQQAVAGLGVNGLTYDQQQTALSAPPGTVIIHTNSDSGRSGRHHRHHHHHSRSRSRHRGSYD